MSQRPRGPLSGWQPKTKRQKAILADVLEQFDALRSANLLPRSPRGVFYDLRPNGHGHGVIYLKRFKVNNKLPKLGPMEADPKTVQEVMVLARRAGIIPENWVADARAPSPLMPATASGAESEVRMIDARLGWLRLDRQDGQDVYVELWCEAEGIAPRLALIARDYGVPVYPAGGFKGLKGKRAAGERVAGRAVPTIALHVGDYDKHGSWIFRSEAEDVAGWADDASLLDLDKFITRKEVVELPTAEGEPLLRVQRLAVTDAQVEVGLVELDHDGKAEAEAIPPAELDVIVRGALDRLLDRARRRLVVAGEGDMRSEVRRLLAERWAS